MPSTIAIGWYEFRSSQFDNLTSVDCHKNTDWRKRWFAFRDFTKGWIPFASEAVAELTRQERRGRILTTSPPESWRAVLHRYCRML